MTSLKTLFTYFFCTVGVMTTLCIVAYVGAEVATSR